MEEENRPVAEKRRKKVEAVFDRWQWHSRENGWVSEGMDTRGHRSSINLPDLFQRAIVN